jgi:hypothetical protein
VLTSLPGKPTLGATTTAQKVERGPDLVNRDGSEGKPKKYQIDEDWLKGISLTNRTVTPRDDRRARCKEVDA